MGGQTPQLSVVTTVWGMSSSVQAGPTYGGNNGGGGSSMGMMSQGMGGQGQGQGGPMHAAAMGGMSGPGGGSYGMKGGPYNPNMQQGGYPQRYG